MNNPATRARRRSIVVAAGLMLALPAFGGGTANPRMGLELARTWCSSCHVVEGAQAAVNAAGAPSFAAIAADPKISPATIHAFLNAPRHPPMPDFQLSRQQMDDVAAYIMSLRR